VALLGGPDDRELTDSILSPSEISDSLASILDLVGKLSLQESAGLIREAELVVCNDSAPLHMASAAGVPTVAIFCATTPEMGFGPWRNPHRVVEVKGLECRPCGRHGGNSCPLGTSDCIKGISVEEVFRSAGELLNGRKGEARSAS